MLNAHERRKEAQRNIDILLDRVYTLGLAGDMSAVRTYVDIVSSHPLFKTKESDSFDFSEDQIKRIFELTQKDGGHDAACFIKRS